MEMNQDREATVRTGRGKQRSTEPKTALAKRLDTAMEIDGYTNDVWAEKLGFTAGNISHWRTGRHAPDVETILAIARMAEASDYFLLTGKPDPRLILARLATARHQLREAFERGENIPDAWERILHQPGLLTEEERDVLADTRSMEVYLASESAFEQFSLSADQQEVVRDLMRLLARYNRDPDGRARRGPDPEP